MQFFFRYCKQRRGLWAVALAFCTIFAVCFLLYRLPIQAVLYPALLCAALGLLLMLLDFRQVKRRHEALGRIRAMTDIMAAAFPPADSLEAHDYQEVIRLLVAEHNHFRTLSRKQYADMVDYYTVWAHQIKTPIAAMRLQLQNEDSAASRKLSSELNRVEQYVEMVLTFLRLDMGSTDYVIREHDLDAVIRQAVKKFSYEFIGRKLRLCYEPVALRVITDEKWLSFVIEQVLSNALKYTQTGSISITLEGSKLVIRDTGIGIAPEDLPRIFENGYTGYNGRTDRKASGIGLYLCKRICANLGHAITATSVVDEGTAVTIDFAQQKLRVE